jgi:hypothetical protein
VAAYLGELDKVKICVSEGADVNAKDPADFMPLHYAICGGQKDVAEFLVGAGADVNAKDSVAKTALHHAIIRGHKELVELLIAKGADISAKDDVQRLLRLLGDEAALVKLLQTHIKAHPGKASAAAKEFLAELPKLRFIARSEDDAEEFDDGRMYMDSSDLELINFYGDQVVGMRFGGIRIPKEAKIKKAYLQFTVDEVSTERTVLTIHAELAANAQSFEDVDHNITSRSKTTASVKWSPELWTVIGEQSEKQRTPDLSSVIQEVVAQGSWQEGNALVLIISGSGKRVAASYDGNKDRAPMLYIEY